MKIKHKKITISNLIDGYVDEGSNGVVGYHGNLDIRPKYQREFVYNEKQQEAVINTIMHGFPLNIMYWNDNGNGEYEVIDGQQRTISICRFATGDFSWHKPGEKISYNYGNLPSDIKEKFLNYELDVYVCTGTESEKLNWFRIINITGEPLEEQELRNAVYAGSFTRDAKDKFANPIGFPLSPDNSRLDNGAFIKYLKFTGNYEEFAKRQRFLELGLKWISELKKQTIEEYMAEHQHDYNANEMWKYFKEVLEWVQTIFPEYHKDMKRTDWNILYEKNKHRKDLEPKELQKEIEKLRADYDVKNSKGIYDYVLSDKSKNAEKYLNIRTFDKRTRETIYEKQKGICPYCHEHFELTEMDADHIVPWNKGGKTIPENCQMLCKKCNRKKGNK